jgi:uncharacterized protein YjeT (DUF2065 family)
LLEEFMGVPAHPLIVHIPVVFIPLLALLAVVYALVPMVRSHTRWVLGLLAIAAPIGALLAKLSGDALSDRMQERNLITPDFLPRIEEHGDLGNMTLYATIALAVVTLALVYFVGPRVAATAAGGADSSRMLSLVLAGLAVVAAGVSLYYVVRTGDTGAKNVWEDI